MSAPPFVVTFWTHETARFKDEREIDKVGLANLIRSEHAEQKNNLRWLKLARFGNNATTRKSLRHDANVQAVYGIEADYDGEQMTFEEACDTLRAHNIDSIVYTSPSHSIEKPRWRVLCILSTHYPPNERAKFVARLQGVFGGVFSEESFTLSQSYYFGYVGNGAMPSQHQVELIDGEFIDLIDELDAGAIGRLKKKTNGDGYDGERPEFVELVRMFLGGEAFHPLLAPIIGKLANEMPRHTLLLVMRGLFDVALKSRPDIGPRWKEVIEVADYVYEKITDKKEPQPGELPPDIVIDDFYAYLPKHWYLYVPTQTLWPPATINSRLPKRDGHKAARWLDKFRAVSQMIWAPAHPQIVTNKHLIEGGWYPKPGAIVFNQYRQPELTGGDAGKAGPWLALFKKLYPNPFEHEHMIRVLAYKLQHPEVKINHALVLGGGMRIGKDTLLLPFKRALGNWNCYEAKPTTIMSAFNGYMRSILLTINETRDLGEVKRIDFYNHMKDVIASPPETVLVNEKHEKGVHVLNVCLVIMTTNHRTDGIYLPPGDGRHFPVWSALTKEEHEPDYFSDFYDWLDRGGDAHVAAYLRSLDVSDFRCGEPPPLTDLFHEIVEQSTPIEVGWLTDILADFHAPVFILKSLVSRAVGEVKEWLENPASRKVIPYRLEDAGYTRVRNASVADGRWMVDGVKQNIYGRKDLPEKERQNEARKLR